MKCGLDVWLDLMLEVAVRGCLTCLIGSCCTTNKEYHNSLHLVLASDKIQIQNSNSDGLMLSMGGLITGSC